MWISHAKPSRHETSLTYLWIVFKLPYLDKTYIRCLQDNSTENNFRCTHKCLEKISNKRCLCQKRFPEKISKCWVLIFGHEVVTTFKFTTSMFQSKIKVLTMLSCFWCWFSNQVSLLQQRRVFEVIFLTKIKLIPDQYHHNLFPKICKFSCNFIFS